MVSPSVSTAGSGLNRSASRLNRGVNPLLQFQASRRVKLRDRRSSWALHEKRADVFAQTRADRDREAAVGGNVEMRSRGIRMRALASIESHAAFTRHDLHPFGRCSLEIIRTGTNKPERLLRLVGHKYRMANDVAIEIDIRLRLNGNAGELRGKRGHESLMSVAPE